MRHAEPRDGSRRRPPHATTGTPSPELAAALAQPGRTRVLAGHSDEAAAPLERALTLAERLLLPEVFVEALTSKGVGVISQGRLAEARRWWASSLMPGTSR
jgi:hypothetical protein